jgi:hypothetical protein
MTNHEGFTYAEDRRWTFETQDLKEILFKQKVEQKIISDYKVDFKELGIDDDSLELFDDVFLDENLSERDREIFCSLPYEIRLRQFKSFFEEFNLKNKTKFNREDWMNFIKYIIDINKDLEPHLGFHATPYNISKDKTPGRFREGWYIKGTENDHRNSDQPMAYYSLSLEKLFRKKEFNTIYVVRANLAPGNNHHPDNDGHWGRAGNLSIISEITFTDEDEQNLNKEIAA